MAIKKPPRPITAPGTPARDPQYAGKISRKAYEEAVSDPAVHELLRAADARWGDAFTPRHGTPLDKR
jgi:hypothetical protein